MFKDKKGPSRRDVLRAGAGLGAFALTVSASPAFAVSGFKPYHLATFYLAVTKAAFEETYGDTLSPKNIANAEDLQAALKGTRAQYQANYLDAAEAYFGTLKSSELGKLKRNLKSRYNVDGGGLLGVMQKDRRDYLRGRKINKKKTNPLFHAFSTLAVKGKITPEDARDWVKNASTLTHGKDVLQEFHGALIERLETVEKAKKSAPSSPLVGSAPKKSF